MQQRQSRSLVHQGIGTFATVDGIAYSSLAICPSVRDISSTVTGNGGFGETTAEWNYTLPPGLYIDRPNVLRTAQFIHGSPAHVFEFEIMALRTNCPDGLNTRVAELNKSRQYVLAPFAARVSLTPCVLSYGQVEVTNDTFEETVKDSTLLNYAVLSYYSIGNRSSIAGVDCAGSPSPQGFKTTITALQPPTSKSDTVRIANYSLILRAPDRYRDILYYDPACVFELGGGAAEGLKSILGTMFGRKDVPQSVRIARGISRQGYGDDWTKVFWNGGTEVNVTTVSKVVDGLTTSINSIFRTRGDPSKSEPLRRVVLVNQACVGIDWPWLALPAILCGWTVSLLVRY